MYLTFSFGCLPTRTINSAQERTITMAAKCLLSSPQFGSLSLENLINKNPQKFKTLPNQNSNQNNDDYLYYIFKTGKVSFEGNKHL